MGAGGSDFIRSAFTNKSDECVSFPVRVAGDVNPKQTVHYRSREERPNLAKKK